jgi:hypothetical protein
MSILDSIKKALRSPNANVTDLREAIRAIDVGALDAAVSRAERERAGLLLDGTEKELDAADTALTMAIRERDRGVAAKALLGERLADAEAAAAKALLDADRASADRTAEDMKRALLTHFVDHQAGMAALLLQLIEAEVAVKLVNDRLAAAGRSDFLPAVETRAFPVPPTQLASVYSILRRTSFRAVGSAPAWNDDASDFLSL